MATPEEVIRQVFIARQAQWSYRIDDFVDQGLDEIKAAIRTAKEDTIRKLRKFRRGTWSEKRATDMLDELDRLGAGIKAKTAEDISNLAAAVGTESLNMHSDILSFGGRVGFNRVALSAAQLKSFFQNTPIGGALLTDWVDRAFDFQLQERIKREIASGVLRGEGYRALSNRIKLGFDNITNKEAETLTRTYVQSANVGAMDAVYNANRDVVKGREWSSVMEPGYKTDGRGTCPRCAALDGEVFTAGTRPQMPLHPNCRCVWLPVTKSYKELGLDIPEIEKVYKPVVERSYKRGRLGGKIKRVDFYKGDYSSWFAKQAPALQDRVIGQTRAELVRNGSIEFKNIIDRRTGRLLTLEELGFTPGKLPTLTRPTQLQIRELIAKLRLTALDSEPGTTRLLQSALEGKDAELVGLPFRIKNAKSTLRKVNKELDANVKWTLKDLTEGDVNDILRYTAQIDTRQYTEVLQDTLRTLKDGKHKVLRVTNYWETPNYKGVNVVMRNPQGIKYELQFHTPESIDVKENISHKFYELIRASKDKKKIAGWTKQMQDGWKSVPRPQNIKDVKNQAFKKR